MDPENQPSPEFSFDSAVTGIGEEILDKMPDIQQHAIEAHESRLQEAAQNAEVDAEGTPFDSAIHTGTTLKSGVWRKKKQAGSNPGSVVAPSRKKQVGAVNAEAAPTADPNAEALATGTVIATLFLGACQSIGGDEWEPSKHERDFQVSAWQSYCVAKNVTQLSPGLALVVALGSYAAPRLTKPKTSAKLGRVANWFAVRVAKWKIKRELKRRGITAEVTIKKGVDGVNEIHINGTPSDEAQELK